ncbi:MAG: GGDEF domain-containing protein [Telluria sp.]
MRLNDFDNNLRRKKILIKYTMLVFLAYTITQLATLSAWYVGISSVQPAEIRFVSAITLGSAVLFALLVYVKKVMSTKFANLVFFGQFAVWLIMYPIWFLSLREIRSMALFCALMALSFLLSHAKLVQSIIITAAAVLMQLVGSYYAIIYLKQPGSFREEVFYTLCFLPAALFICHLSDQYAKQRSEVKQAKHAAEQSSAALRIESEKAHRLNGELQGALTTIQEISIRDVLTGLYNRRHLLDRLEMEKKRADRTGQLFSIVILDIDHFKRINDTFGHLHGDEVLKAVASLLQDSLRGTDFCARFGGEEFVMLLEQTSEDGALVCAERARRLVESAKFSALGDDFQVTVSLGVTWYQPKEQISQALSRADEALYRAKHAGRNRVETSSAATDGPAQNL